jgi:ferredoxin, 2Fe-2S
VPTVIYIQPDGTSQTIEAEPGASVMETAVDNDVEGIVAECGGACSCATCHVYVDAAWADRLDAPDAQEDGMLDCVLDRQKTSRLSCQIIMSDALDGLVVHVPESQI